MFCTIFYSTISADYIFCNYVRSIFSFNGMFGLNKATLLLLERRMAFLCTLRVLQDTSTEDRSLFSAELPVTGPSHKDLTMDRLVESRL